MPLAWAHAEYTKLVRSLMDGRVFDMCPQPYHRYVRRRTSCSVNIWASHAHTTVLMHGCALRVQTSGPARVHWRADGGEAQETMTRDAGLGVWVADLETRALGVGTTVRFVAEGIGGEHAVVVR